MNPKMKSAIEKITLNDATFSNEVIEPTYVNFFYGKNGAGKSTNARTFKAHDERLQWQAGKASTDYDVLVYDTDFINANLSEYEVKVQLLVDAITINKQRIAAKIKEPTSIASLEDTDSLLIEIGTLIDGFNKKSAVIQK